MLVKLAREGKRVLRLKGGDPFMFGRGGEEIEMLAERGRAVSGLPGVTAATGAAAYSGIPLTHRDHAQACIFVTGHGKDGQVDLDWNALVQPSQTVAIYMGLRNLEPLMPNSCARGQPRLAGRNRRQCHAAEPARGCGHAVDARGFGEGRRAEGPVGHHRGNGGDTSRQTRFIRRASCGEVRAALNGVRRGRNLCRLVKR